MRRRSFARPTEKLRGVERRLRALDRWADSFEGTFPVRRHGEPCWNCKLPVLDRLVAPPQTRPQIQSRAAAALLRAADRLRESRPAGAHDALVTALVTWPDMFFSELCVFLDEDHLGWFFTRDESSGSLVPTSRPSLSRTLGFEVPAGFDERGYDFRHVEVGDGHRIETDEQWWSYRAHDA